MSGRKLKLYGDADIDSIVDGYLREHKRVNYRSVREIGYSSRGDDHHYHEAARQGRVVVTHDDGYLSPRYRVQRTNGVIVIKRGRNRQYVADAFEKFLRWWWTPALSAERGVLGNMKVELSADGFHYWIYSEEGQDEQGYYSYTD